MKEGLFMERKKKGFTIIELIVVISIIIMLATLVGGAVYQAKEYSRRQKARADIYSLSVALRAYETDYGLFPADPAAGNASMINALLSISRNGPYIEIKQGDLDSGGHMIDPWKRAYVYENNVDGDNLAGGPHNPGSFDIYSLGYDGVTLGNPGTGPDDINNWD